MLSTGQGDVRVVEITDERTPLARNAIRLIQSAIWDVHPMGMLLEELEETRKGEAHGGGYHLLALVEDGSDRPLAAAAGAYLQAVNAGFIAYLAVREDRRAEGLGRRLRDALLDAFREQARREGGVELGRVLGEVERDSAWLKALVRQGRVVPLDVPYFHPWMSRSGEGHYALYLEPLADARRVLPSAEVGQMIEAIWRRAYHFRSPERRDTFRYMQKRLAQKPEIGADPEIGLDS